MNNLAKPRDALTLIKEMEKIGKQLGLETYRAPFGWCKKFSISIKGHPLAEHLRIISCESVEEEVVCEALKAEKELRSSWYILQTDGKMTPIEEFDFKGYDNLEKLAKYEIEKVSIIPVSGNSTHSSVGR